MEQLSQCFCYAHVSAAPRTRLLPRGPTAPTHPWQSTPQATDPLLRNYSPSDGRHKAFTLVELLVVVAIIIVLIAILLPALGRARNTSKTVACSSNLRQIGLGFNVYAYDNNTILPPGSWSNWVGSDGVNWLTLINPYLGGTGETVNTSGYGTANPTISKAFQCPGATLPGGYNHFTSNPIMLPRSQDISQSAGRFPMPQKLGTLQNASGLALVMDGIQEPLNSQPVAFMMDSGSPFWGAYMKGGLGNTTRYRLVPFGPNYDGGTSTPPGGDIRWRHQDNNAINVVYADGHAATQIIGTLTENNFFPPDWRSY